MTDSATTPPPSAFGTALADAPDRIFMRDYVRVMEIGAFAEEVGVTQRVRFSIELELAPRAEVEDMLRTVISYDSLVEAVEGGIAAGRVNLLETLAEEIAARCLVDDRALRVIVRVEKLDRGPGALGVEIARRRAEG